MEKIKIYTSYFGNSRNLAKNNVLCVSVARYSPKFYYGLKMPELAPQGYMLAKDYPPEKYTRDYWNMLSKLNPHAIVKKLESFCERQGKTEVALLCYEKQQNECHREYIAQWLNRNGYNVQEFGVAPAQKKQAEQLYLF